VVEDGLELGWEEGSDELSIEGFNDG